MSKLKTDGSDGRGQAPNLRNAVETLGNIFYLIEVDPELPEGIKRLLPLAESAMKTLRDRARQEMNHSTGEPDY